MFRVLHDPDGEVTGGEATPPSNEAVASTPPAPSIPDGHRLVRDDEWQSYSRAANEYRGLRGRFEKAGVQDIPDEALSFIANASKHKQDFSTLNEALFGENGVFVEQQQGGQTPAGDYLSRSEAEKWLEEKLSQNELKVSALTEHKAAEAEARRMLTELRNEMGLPEKIGDDDHFNQFLDYALAGARIKGADIYGDDSPLAGELRPLGKDALDAFRGLWQGFQKAAEAKYQMGLAKKRGGSTPTAGDSTRASDTKETQDDDGPRKPHTREDDRSDAVKFLDELEKQGKKGAAVG